MLYNIKPKRFKSFLILTFAHIMYHFKSFKVIVMRKGYFLLLLACLFAIPTFGVPSHDNYIVQDDVLGSWMHSYYGTWTPGAPPTGEFLHRAGASFEAFYEYGHASNQRWFRNHSCQSRTFVVGTYWRKR